MFTLKFTLNNDAFMPEADDMQRELARILKHVAREIELIPSHALASATGVTVRGINGNVIGTWEIRL